MDVNFIQRNLRCCTRPLDALNFTNEKKMNADAENYGFVNFFMFIFVGYGLVFLPVWI